MHLHLGEYGQLSDVGRLLIALLENSPLQHPIIGLWALQKHLISRN